MLNPSWFLEIIENWFDLIFLISLLDTVALSGWKPNDIQCYWDSANRSIKALLPASIYMWVWCLCLHTDTLKSSQNIKRTMVLTFQVRIISRVAGQSMNLSKYLANDGFSPLPPAFERHRSMGAFRQWASDKLWAETEHFFVLGILGTRMNTYALCAPYFMWLSINVHIHNLMSTYL